MLCQGRDGVFILRRTKVKRELFPETVSTGGEIRNSEGDDAVQTPTKLWIDDNVNGKPVKRRLDEKPPEPVEFIDPVTGEVYPTIALPFPPTAPLVQMDACLGREFTEQEIEFNFKNM